MLHKFICRKIYFAVDRIWTAGHTLPTPALVGQAVRAAAKLTHLSLQIPIAGACLLISHCKLLQIFYFFQMFLKYCPDSLNHLFDRCVIKPCMGQVGEVLIHVFRFPHFAVFSTSPAWSTFQISVSQPFLIHGTLFD